MSPLFPDLPVTAINPCTHLPPCGGDDKKGSVVDGAVAQDLSQLHSMWSLREHAPVAASLAGYTYKYDVSVPVGDFQALADETRRRLRDRLLMSEEGGDVDVTVVAYGHLGDGNLHLNVCVPAAAGAGAAAGARARARGG